jgi:hypothetical protein
MKQADGGFVEPFNFSDHERDRLLETFGGATRQQARREKAANFVDRAQSLIELWLHLNDSEVPRAVELRDKCAEIAARAGELRALLDTLPEGISSTLSAEFQAVVFYAPSLSVDLRMYTAKRYPDLYDAWPLLNALLESLEKSSRRVAENVKPTTGPTQRREAALVAWLADAYFEAIGRAPSTSRNGNFRLFLAALSEVLSERGTNASFGDATIGMALSKNEGD